MKNNHKAGRRLTALLATILAVLMTLPPALAATALTEEELAAMGITTGGKLGGDGVSSDQLSTLDGNANDKTTTEDQQTSDTYSTGADAASLEDEIPVKYLAMDATLRLDKIGQESTLKVSSTPADTTDTLTWSTGDKTVATVNQNGTVTAVGPGKTDITVSGPTPSTGNAVTASCEVTVTGVRVTEVDSTELLTALTVTQNHTANVNYTCYGDALGGGTAAWISGDSSIASVSGGRVTGRSVGSTTITVEVGDYSAEFDVTVVENTANVISDTIASDETLSFNSLLSKLNTMCKSSTDGDLLKYITGLTVDTDAGTVYYNYVSGNDQGAGVGATERYYYADTGLGEQTISNLTFVPESSFQGTATIQVTGISTGGKSFSCEIQVGVTGTSNIPYDTTPGTAVAFRAEDFSELCQNRNGRSLSYVTFTLPSSSKGTLYYHHVGETIYVEDVEASTKYYNGRTPSLDNVYFHPTDGYTGTVRISYRATDTAGNTYTGQVSVIVTGGTVGDGDIAYSGKRGATISFSASDFNSACQDALSETLSYVRFTLPGSSSGTLYYKYSSSSVSAVTATTRYYRSGSPNLSDVSFVPSTSAASTVYIDFTAYSTSGSSYQGQVQITLTGNADYTLSVSYTGISGGTVSFSSDDFNTACKNVLGVNFSYIKFESLPSTTSGVLYETSTSKSRSSSTSKTKVTTSTKFYRSSSTHTLSQVSLVAGDTYKGTLTIPFTGADVNGQDFSGTVTILVSSPIASTIYYSTESTAVVLNASDLSQTCLSTTGQSLSSIRFTSLPSSSCGQMLSGYTGLGTGTTVRTSDVFSVSDASALRQLAFVPKAGFSGQVSLSYQGSDTSGASYSGTIVIAVTPTGSASRFADMTYYSWAAPAVEFLAENGVVSGISTEEYGPSLVVQRGAFVTMLANAFQLPTTYGASSFSDVSSSSYYSGAVAAAKNLGIVAGTNGLFLPNNQVTRQDAAVMLYRAMQVAGYALPNYNSDALSAFSDGAQVSDYAQEALSTLVQLGVMQGNSSGQLCPNSPMTRAELAVVLHQILTL